MKAAVVREYGVPIVGSFDDPVPGAGEVVVEVSAAGVNPVDLATARGAVSGSPRPPFVAGREGIGTVQGKRFYFDGPVQPYGSMAERALVPAANLYDVPEALEDGVAVALGIAGLAAWVSLAWRAKLQPGETVLILGASGIVGRLAVQAARLQGAGQIVAAARDGAGREAALDLGADVAIDLGGDRAIEEIAADMKNATSKGADVTIDLVYGSATVAAIMAAAPGARHVQVGSASGPTTSLPAPILRERMIDFLGYTTRHAPRDVVRTAYAQLCRYAAADKIRTEVEALPMSEVAHAWARQASSPHRKLVLIP